MVTLKSIAAQVEQITAAYPDFSLEQADVFSLLDVIGDENAHLQRMSTDALSWKRTMPLKEDQPVLGDYLCIEYTAHRPELLLVSYTSRQALQDAILADSGITNIFTTFMIPFIKGTHAPYQITYRTVNSVITVFDKGNQFSGKESVETLYYERQLKWLL